MTFERNAEDRIGQYLKIFPAVAILGPRQCGKTTVARMLKPDWAYIDLEKGSDYDFVTQDFDFFFRNHPAHVIFDEAQRSAELFRELRGVIDEDRATKGRFILTGSSSPDLVANLTESLAGRVGIIELGTFKCNERYRRPLPSIYDVLHAQTPEEQRQRLLGLKPELSVDQVLTHFLFGGYPEPTVQADPEFFAHWMSNYRQAYIDRDIRRLFPRLNPDNYRRFLSMLGELSGTIVNRSEVGRSLNVSESTVRDYLDIAAGTFMWRNLPSLERTVSKSIVKMPRGYIRDSGLLHSMVGVHALEHLYRRAGTGAAFEAFVIEEIIQGIQSIETSPWQYRYYRTRNGAEVDLVLTSPAGQRIPVEVKFGISTKRADLRSLATFIDKEGLPYGILINNAETVKQLTDAIIQIPSTLL